ncbi:peptide ABC transporter substrate-binding protein [Kouleothrix sp.]|uniref:peptide ABC transporter substrate-binding protein n=1 Tax=Kouleothrix sp. TaxID=2779161 RepID=UPI003918865A
MKKPNQRNRLIFALLLALLLPILAACGGGGETPAGSTGEQATSAAPAGGETAATAEPAATAAGSADATAAPGAGGGSAGNVLRVAASTGTWPDTLDPQKASFSNEIAVLQLNYEGLTRYDKDLKTVPAAAEKWEYNSDATQVTFHLRDGLKYSDGSPLTAQDFVNAVYRTLDPHSPGDYQTSLFMIKGADAIINTEVPTDEAKLPDLQKALGVKATDDKTITFDLAQPTPYFHTLAAIWVMYPAKQDLVSKGGETWYEDAANQIGNGPWQISSIDKSGNKIEFKANENYWGGKPKLDAVEYTYIQDLTVALQAYKNGEVDIMAPDPNDVPTIKSDATLSKEYTEYAGACTSTVSFNLSKPPFNNPKVREAFAYGFDRDGYVRDALKDTEIPTLTWIPPGYPGYDKAENRFGYDPAKAKAALAEAGFADGKGLPEIKYTYNSNNPANQARAEYIVQMYQKSLGVTIVPDPVEGTTLTAMRKSNETYPMITTAGWCADYPDQQDWLSIYWHSSTSFARDTGYKNADVDKLLEQADVETDAAKRTQLYDQAQKLVIADVGEMMRSNTKNYYLIKPYVKGLEFTPQDSDVPGQQTGLFNVTIEK